VLIKLIDVNALASVQVHPDDEGARRLEGEAAGQGPARGKTEAWYIISRSTEARFSLGLAPRVTPEAFREALQRGTAPELLASPEVREGDCLFVPPGTVHAAGNGVLLLEVQQSSDLTYRVYDWDRVDAQGRRRELHVDKALQVIDFSARPRIYHAEGGPDSLARILECPYFEMWEARVAGTLSLPPQPALASATVVRGTLRLRGRSTSLRLSPGDTFVLPAGQDAVLERSGNGQDSALAVLTLVR
jgi:mannose-6-phosphate isomerase